MREFKRGDSISCWSKEESEKVISEIHQYNINQIARAIETSEYAKKLEQLYGSSNYQLRYLIDYRAKSERLESFNIDSFVANVRVKHVKFNVERHADEEVKGTGNYSGTIDSNGNISVSEDTITVGYDVSYSVSIKSNNFENLKVRVYHFASNHPNFNAVFNSVLDNNTRDEYKRIKKESASRNGKFQSYHKQGKILAFLHIIAMVVLFAIPVCSYSLKEAVFSYSVLAICGALLLPIFIAVFVFNRKLRKGRGIDLDDTQNPSADMSIAESAVISVILLAIVAASAFFRVIVKVENNTFLDILRIAGMVLIFIFIFFTGGTYKRLLPMLRDSDDKVEQYLASTKLSQFEANVAFVKENIICKKLR